MSTFRFNDTENEIHGTSPASARTAPRTCMRHSINISQFTRVETVVVSKWRIELHGMGRDRETSAVKYSGR